jgi:hypothetical protein
MKNLKTKISEDICFNETGVCKCTQCRGSKERQSPNSKRFFKRFLNKKRRQVGTKMYFHMWA